MNKLHYMRKSDLTDRYYYGRWPYLSVVVARIKRLNIGSPDRILEAGAKIVPVVAGCDTLDMDARTAPTILHDMRKTPWPIEDNAYDLLVALQVLEHLGPKDGYSQMAAAVEARRVARHVLISVPFHWSDSGCIGHDDIGICDVVRWFGCEPDEIRTVDNRLVCMWSG